MPPPSSPSNASEIVPAAKVEPVSQNNKNSADSAPHTRQDKSHTPLPHPSEKTRRDEASGRESGRVQSWHYPTQPATPHTASARPAWSYSTAPISLPQRSA